MREKATKQKEASSIALLMLAKFMCALLSILRSYCKLFFLAGLHRSGVNAMLNPSTKQLLDSWLDSAQLSNQKIIQLQSDENHIDANACISETLSSVVGPSQNVSILYYLFLLNKGFYSALSLPCPSRWRRKNQEIINYLTYSLQLTQYLSSKGDIQEIKKY